MGLRSFLRHLRLHFQLVLAPVFLLGFAQAGGVPGWSFLALFLLVHVGLYGGATAYNSYCDQDTGPVGGMKHPPPAGRLEQWGGLGLQALSVVSMGWWGWRMAGLGLFMLALGIAYSHPRWRWKARPLTSLLTVTVGQGLAPFFMGALAVPGGWAPGWESWLLSLVSALFITGIYPLTQVYQIAEDRHRGDCTFAVHYGPERVFQIARGLVGAGMGLLGGVMLAGAVFRAFWVWVLPAGYAAFWWAIHMWRRRFARQTPHQNHDWALGVCAGASGLFWIFLGAEFAR